MVSSCVAFGCTNRAKQKPGITFHVFPKDKTLRDAWQRAVRRDGWEPKNADVLCSEHFEANCFDRTGQTTRLRPGSIPTIFPAFPAHLQKPAKRKREAPKCRTALSPLVSAEAAVEMSSEPSSPAKDWYRSKAEESAQEVLQLKKKVKTLQQSKRRLSKRCDASENLIKELKERKLLSENGLEVFEATFSPEIQQLLVRAHEKTNKMYPPELRAFALTLHYYSAAAYEYVQSKFNNALPSQRTLREWYKSVNGDPGFTSEAFDFIKNLAKSQDKPLIAALMMDDMAIKKHVQLVGKKVVGYIDLGTGISDDSLPDSCLPESLPESCLI
ncbi:THAP domain-containing protein 2-like [Rhipicephalus microplus]|uniref:THAP domain-containing protein 2-like n=1 Tax=Rhipicephalus microplus TaxID=6941 RepID=UPI003F6B9426